MFTRTDSRFRELRHAFEEGWSAMKRGSSLDGVEAAVRYMEESGVFNSGRGACLTIDGRVELDAAVMRGDTREGAGVGVVTCTYHPVSLARWVMEKTKHVLIAGTECSIYAKAAGMDVVDARPSQASLERFEELRLKAKESKKENSRLWASISPGNTVGAVAIDSSGLASAAVSTGGTWFKLPGRIGDSAVLGAGIYADDRLGAACATGVGEEIIRNGTCMKACSSLEDHDAASAAIMAVDTLTKNCGRDTVGIVTVDKNGKVGASWNTEAMGRAWYDHNRNTILVEV